MASFNPRSVRAVLGGIILVVVIHIILKSALGTEGFAVKCGKNDCKRRHNTGMFHIPDLLRSDHPDLKIRSQEPRYTRCSRCHSYEPCEHRSDINPTEEAEMLKQELNNYIKNNINEASTAVMYNDPSKSGAIAASLVDNNNREASWGDQNTDTSKYFERHANDNASIMIPSYGGIPVKKNPRQAQVDPMSGNPIYVQPAASGQETIAPINLGVYKEEKVMNGGMFGSVRGMDNGDSIYAKV